MENEDNELTNFLDGLKESTQKFLYFYTKNRDKKIAEETKKACIRIAKEKFEAGHIGSVLIGEIEEAINNLP